MGVGFQLLRSVGVLVGTMLADMLVVMGMLICAMRMLVCVMMLVGMAVNVLMRVLVLVFACHVSPQATLFPYWMLALKQVAHKSSASEVPNRSAS
jgi:hypothetical protein